MPDRFEPRSSSSARRGAAMAIALALLGCVQAMPGGTPTGTAPLAGLAQFPEAMVEAGQVLPTGIGSVIQAGGQVLPTGVGSYRVRHAGHGHGLEELPVVGATVVLRDPATRDRLAGMAPVRTGEGGRFRFEAVPTAANHLVEVVFLQADGSAAHRLLSLARGGGDVRVSWRSTAAVAHWLQTPGRDWQSIDAAAIALEEAAQGARVEALPEADRLSYFGMLLSAPASALGPDGPPAEALPLPVLPTAAPSGSPSPVPSLVPSPLASTVGQVVETTGETVETTADTVGDVVETTSDTVGEAVETTTETVDQTTGTVDDVVDTTTDTVEEILPSPDLL